MALRINYTKVVSQARSINNLSGDLSSEISRLEQLLNDVKNNWKGPASDAYQRQLYNLIQSMKQTKSRMASLSSTIKSAADRIKREDDLAAARAAALKS